MKTVRQLLEIKGRDVVVISPNASLFDATQLMTTTHIGALLVLDAANKLVGIVSERDCARKIAMLNRLMSDVRVAEIMTSKIAYVRPEQTNEECMALVTEKRVRHLPVLENDRLIGLLSIGDLVKDAISEKDFIIEQLVNYIRG
ncbi:MAG: CBS domain-containing protein [Rhodocyclales bacterium]|nr:CBS domain-containing protein [Rhodocyclales bacterium]